MRPDATCWWNFPLLCGPGSPFWRFFHTFCILFGHIMAVLLFQPSLLPLQAGGPRSVQSVKSSLFQAQEILLQYNFLKISTLAYDLFVQVSVMSQQAHPTFIPGLKTFQNHHFTTLMSFTPGPSSLSLITGSLMPSGLQQKTQSLVLGFTDYLIFKLFLQVSYSLERQGRQLLKCATPSPQTQTRRTTALGSIFKRNLCVTQDLTVSPSWHQQLLSQLTHHSGPTEYTCLHISFFHHQNKKQLHQSDTFVGCHC